MWGCHPSASLRPDEWTDGLTWSGHRWTARSSRFRTGAGPNRWTAASDALFVDDEGTLHLRPTWSGSVEISTELPDCPLSLHVALASASVPDGWIAGVFVYRHDRSEMDLELGRWPGTPPPPEGFTHGQFVVSGDEQRIRRFTVPDGPATFSLDWHDHQVGFELGTRRSSVRAEFDGSPVPAWEGHRLHVNLWALPHARPTPRPELLLSGVTLSCRVP